MLLNLDTFSKILRFIERFNQCNKRENRKTKIIDIFINSIQSNRELEKTCKSIDQNMQ
jgi:hypothetical protein